MDNENSHPNLSISNYSYGTIISAVASVGLRDVITGPWEDTGDLACTALDSQLRRFEEAEQDREQRSSSTDTSLFEAAAARVAQSLGDDPDAEINAINSLPLSLISRAFGENWERLPYAAFCSARANAFSNKAEQPTLFSADKDEWILQNERWLRDEKKRDWRWGLVKFSTQMAIVFPGCERSESHITVQRPRLDGKAILDLKRTDSIQLQLSLPLFVSAFESLTGGLLNKLEWDHIFVAGGMALSCLLATDLEVDADKYRNSDIDLYVYGLDPVAANKKVDHIYKTWLSNLPPASEPHVLRNSRTITLLAKYPIKRIQIVLKLVKNPKEVLLNFDLDPCSLGFDGSELWLLPRAARALESELNRGTHLAKPNVSKAGYSVFTMDLIHGHYLGERRASQESRVFKYADKGFGIRFLPSYLDSLPPFTSDTERVVAGVADDPPLLFDDVLERGRSWTARLIQVRNGDVSSANPPTMTHDEIVDRKLNSSDPAGRSALQNLERLMRHVALWEHACRGVIILNNTNLAWNNYDDELSPIGYDEGPHYAWDSTLTFTKLSEEISKINRVEGLVYGSNLEQYDVEIPELQEPRWRRAQPGPNNLEALSYQFSSIQRMVLLDTLGDVASPRGDSLIPVHLPESVFKKCNDTILAALKDHGLPHSEPSLIPGLKDHWMQQLPESRQQKLVPALWRIDAIRCWQLIDRRIDETYEILWAFRAANATLEAPEEERINLLITQLSKRAIRSTPEDEFASFATWVAHPPQKIGFSYGSFYDTGAYDSGDEDAEW